MDNQETVRSNSEKAATESLGNLASNVPNGGTFDQHPLNRDTAHFQQLIPNDHAQLPPGPQFGMGHHFVTPFPTYMHAVPTGMYMMEEQGDNSGKRRRRTNYRDPENAAKLTTALGILIKQKEENKPQDLKSIASHFGLPYNTLRDNYLKVTTGRLLKDRGDKRPMPKMDGEVSPSSASKLAKKAAVPRSSSNNSSANNTPREHVSAPHAASQQPHMSYGNGLSVNNGHGPPQFSPYPVFHPPMGMHFMPQMHNLSHMQGLQMPNGAMQAPMNTMHHPMLNGPPQMMHMFAPAPMGYQINPANGRPFPVYAGPLPGSGGDMQAQMHAQMQGQMMNPGMLSMTLPAPINTNNTNNAATTDGGDTSPTTSSGSTNAPSSSGAHAHSLPLPQQQQHHLHPQGMFVPAPMQMGMPLHHHQQGQGQGPGQGQGHGQGQGGPMFAPAGMFAQHLMIDPLTGAPVSFAPMGSLPGSGLHPVFGNGNSNGNGNGAPNGLHHGVQTGPNGQHAGSAQGVAGQGGAEREGSDSGAAVVTPSAAHSAAHLAAAMTTAYPTQADSSSDGNAASTATAGTANETSAETGTANDAESVEASASSETPAKESETGRGPSRRKDPKGVASTPAPASAAAVTTASAAASKRQ